MRSFHFILVAFFLTLSGLTAPAAAQEDISAALENAQTRYASIRADIENGEVDDPQQLEEELRALREQSRIRLGAVDRGLVTVQNQIDLLGAPPGENDPPETEELAERRAKLNEELARFVSQKVRINANIAEANELLGLIASSRVQTLYTRMLDRGDSPLSPSVWRPAWTSAKATSAKIGDYFREWSVGKKQNASLGRAIIIISGAFGVSLFLFWPVNHWIMSTFSEAIAKREPTTGRRVVVAGLKMIARALPGAIAGYIIIETVRAQGVISAEGESAARVFLLVIIDYLLVSGFLSGLFAPANPKWRIAPVNAPRARAASALVISIVIIFGLKVLLSEILAAAGAEPELIRMSDAIGAVATGMLLFMLCRRRLWYSSDVSKTSGEIETIHLEAAGSPSDGIKKEDKPHWVRWRLLRRFGRALAIITVLGALVGYVSLADFVAGRVYYLALILAVAWFVRALLRETVFWAFGRLSSSEDELEEDTKAEAATDNFRFWTNWLINLALLLALIPVVLVLTGIPASNVADMAWQALFGFRIGGVSIPSFAKILYALIVFVAVLGLTKVIQRSIQSGPFKHSRIDIGVQNSLITLLGYAGLLIAIFAGVSTVGFDLGNLALIAGALSVGIGFGLQSIVNNFVSGLILLFERPIKVGDWIVTTAGEGIVKKISVRSTEIETWDRSSIIVPNSEMISSAVKNWTHKNKVGRITVPVGVSYGTDPEKVKEILLKCANDHPGIVRYPAPFVVWQDFGASSLDFEIRAYLADISNGLGVRTDLRFAIFAALKEAGIEIPFPQRDLHVKSIPDGARFGSLGENDAGA